MNDFKTLRKHQKQRVVDSGAIRRVAERTGKSRAAVSRTFSGVTKDPDPNIVVELWSEADYLGGYQQLGLIPVLQPAGS